jgi:hypothetical protein
MSTRTTGCNASTPIIKRFFSRVQKTDTCWIWTGAKHPAGYGRLMFGGHSTCAHRLSWMLHRGALNQDVTIDHLCHNKLCVNPDHLEPVSRGENARRYMLSRTHCSNGHAFNKENTAINHNGHRRCKACARMFAKKYAAMKRSAA